MASAEQLRATLAAERRAWAAERAAYRRTIAGLHARLRQTGGTMIPFGLQPAFLNVDRHWKTQVGHGLITLAVGLAGLVVGIERWTVTAALLFYLGREIQAHRYYRRRFEEGAISRDEHAKHRWDSKLDVAWPVLAAGIVWTLPWAGEAWPWWAGATGALLLIGHATDPGGFAGGME